MVAACASLVSEYGFEIVGRKFEVPRSAASLPGDFFFYLTGDVGRYASASGR